MSEQNQATAVAQPNAAPDEGTSVHETLVLILRELRHHSNLAAEHKRVLNEIFWRTENGVVTVGVG